MTRVARFKIFARLDGHRIEGGTVMISREADLMIVRPLRRRRTYELPLSTVATMLVERVIKAELAAKKAEKLRIKKERARERRLLRRHA